MGQFKPMVKMMTTEPSVELKLKKGGAVKKAMGGFLGKAIKNAASGVANANNKGIIKTAMPAMKKGAPSSAPMFGKKAMEAVSAAPKKPGVVERMLAMKGLKKSVGAPSTMPSMPPGMKKGGKTKMSDDMSQDKAMIKKAFKQHDMQEHKGGKGTKLALKNGGKAYATGGVVKGQGGYATGGVVDGQGGYATGGVVNGQGGYKKGGSAKKAFAAGGKVDSGHPVAMPQGNKKPSKPAIQNNLSGVFKDGGKVAKKGKGSVATMCSGGSLPMKKASGGTVIKTVPVGSSSQATRDFFAAQQAKKPAPKPAPSFVSYSKTMPSANTASAKQMASMGFKPYSGGTVLSKAPQTKANTVSAGYKPGASRGYNKGGVVKKANGGVVRMADGGVPPPPAPTGDAEYDELNMYIYNLQFPKPEHPWYIDPNAVTAPVTTKPEQQPLPPLEVFQPSPTPTTTTPTTTTPTTTTPTTTATKPVTTVKKTTTPVKVTTPVKAVTPAPKTTVISPTTTTTLSSSAISKIPNLSNEGKTLLQKALAQKTLMDQGRAIREKAAKEAADKKALLAAEEKKKQDAMAKSHIQTVAKNAQLANQKAIAQQLATQKSNASYLANTSSNIAKKQADTAAKAKANPAAYAALPAPPNAYTKWYTFKLPNGTYSAGSTAPAGATEVKQVR